MLPDVPEGDPERDLSLQHEGASQEHVGAQARVQTLQGAEVEPITRSRNRTMHASSEPGDGQCTVVYAHIATM